jgi:RHS repeat-associated protein
LTSFALYEAYGTRPYEWSDGVTGDPDRQKANTKEEESDLNLLNEGMRFRDLETGVFLTRDPIGYGDGPNVYCYVHCNPITSFDAFGLNAIYNTDGDLLHEDERTNDDGIQLAYTSSGEVYNKVTGLYDFADIQYAGTRDEFESSAKDVKQSSQRSADSDAGKTSSSTLNYTASLADLSAVVTARELTRIIENHKGALGLLADGSGNIQLTAFPEAMGTGMTSMTKLKTVVSAGGNIISVGSAGLHGIETVDSVRQGNYGDAVLAGISTGMDVVGMKGGAIGRAASLGWTVGTTAGTLYDEHIVPFTSDYWGEKLSDWGVVKAK